MTGCTGALTQQAADTLMDEGLEKSAFAGVKTERNHNSCQDEIINVKTKHGVMNQDVCVGKNISIKCFYDTFSQMESKGKL